MKIYCTTNKQTYDMQISLNKVENQIFCPVCKDDRKKKNTKSMSFNTTKETGFCHHCEAKFIIYKEMEFKKDFKTPVLNDNILSENTIKYLQSRGISKETAQNLYITEVSEYMPQVNEKRNCICFNYFRGSKLVNIKYRDGAKNFKLYSGAELIPYNLNSIIGQKEAIWVEGEIDVLSFVEAGIKNVVSVPNGAGKKTQNLQFIDNVIDEIDNIELHFIAVDNDEPGQSLKNELIRRFGAENCKVIEFEDCKDANEYLQKYGKSKLSNILSFAKEIPLSGVYSVDDDMDGIIDLWRNGMHKGLDIMHSSFNDNCTWVSSAVAVWTGIPGHGKSEFVDEVCVHLNILHAWKTGYYSPENYPIKLHVSKLVSKISGKTFSRNYIGQEELMETVNYVKDNFFFIYPENDDYTIDNILAHAKSLIKRKGIKVLVIDPYNKIEHLMDRNETETMYISRILDKLDMFAKRNDILIHLVAHPTKQKKNTSGVYEMPTMYDISGSAHFYNKCFYGLSIFRNKETVDLGILKVKFKHLGGPATINFRYNYVNGRYQEISLENMHKQYNNESFLKFEKPQKDIDFNYEVNNNIECNF